MTNLASVLKGEIARIARKEMRAEVASLKKASAGYRADIAALKKRAAELERALKAASRTVKKLAPPAAAEETGKTVRFSPKSLASQRKRLGLSAAECGLLVGASGQSIYNWEEGKVRPRADAIAAIAALRHMGKKDVAARLEAMKSAEAPPSE